MSIKQLFSVAIAAGILISCGEANKEEASHSQSEQETNLNQESNAQRDAEVKEYPLTGYYVGDFIAAKMDDKKSPMYSNKINISVDSITGDKIFGHSVVAGNARPFSGTFNKNENVYHAEVTEPGNNKYDGKFVFNIDPTVPVLAGRWFANDKALAVSERTFTLEKKEFKYDPDQNLQPEHSTVYNSYTENAEEAITEDAAKFNASNTLLKSSDVENMYKRDLEVMRNAIYARHGYSFKNRQMRYFFDGVPWYIPVSTDVTKDLTEIEKTNIALIKRYEEHATAYYDEYGR